MSLIQNIETLKEFWPASVALDFKDIEPQIRIVQRNVIAKTFGPEIVSMAMAMENQQTTEVKKLMQEALAFLALAKYLPFGMTQISSAGIQIASNQNMKTAFEWQTTTLREEAVTTGWQAIESVCDFLDLTTNEGLKNAWMATDFKQKSLGLLVPSIKVFQQYVNISDSHIMFFKLLPFLLDSQDEVVRPCLTDALFDKMMNPPAGDAMLIKKLSELRKKAEKCVCFFAMSNGYQDISLLIKDNGIFAIEDIQARLTNTKKTISLEQSTVISESYKVRANGMLQEIIEFCNANSNVLTDFRISPNFITETDSEHIIYRNPPDAGIVFF